MVKVGLLIKKPDSIFSNGCVQQPLFLKKCLERADCQVVFIGIEADYTEFEQTKEPIIYTTPMTDFTSFDVIVLASVVLLENDNNMPYIKNLQKHDLAIVNFTCGNIFVLHQEEFVFNKHHIMHHYMQSYYHLNWIMEMYDYCQDYLRIMSNKETEVVPYIWDPDIIESYVSNNNLLRSLGTDRSKINIMIFEANMSIHKNALVPLLICEEFYRKYPDRLNKIYVFCCDSLLRENEHMIKWLAIFKDRKVEVYGRIVMPYIVDVISKNNNYLSVMLSFTLLNRLNFIHLEMMYLGIPIVHNCEPFELNGNYYEDHDLAGAARALEKIRIDFESPSAYKEACREIINRYSSSDTTRVATYKRLVQEIVKTLKKSSSSTKVPESKPILEVTSMLSKNQEVFAAPAPTTRALPSKSFKTGAGVQMILSDSKSLGLCRAILRDWRERYDRKDVEIVHTPMVDDVLIKEIKNDMFHNVRVLKLPHMDKTELLEVAREYSRFVDIQRVSWSVYENTKNIHEALIRL